MPHRLHLTTRILRVILAVIAVLLAALTVPLLLAPILSTPRTAIAAPGDFRLPVAGGIRLFSLQGQNQGSHVGPYNRFAYDFATGPFDNTSFTVAAARAGKVVRTVQSYPPSGDCDLATSSLTNYILLDHGDNVGTWYSHLLQNSVKVKVGEQVAQGQPLAFSDHSGYVCGVSHLHFTAVNIKTMAGVDIIFADPSVAPDGGSPQTSKWYVAANPPPAGTAASMPAFRVSFPIIQKKHWR